MASSGVILAKEPPSCPWKVTMLMRDQEWLTPEGAQKEFIDAFERNGKLSVTVLPQNQLPAGRYLWVASRTDQETPLEDAYILETVVDRVLYEELPRLSTSSSSSDQFAPLSKLQVRMGAMKFSELSKRILIVERGSRQQEEDDTSKVKIKVEEGYVEEDYISRYVDPFKKELDTDLSVHIKSSPYETIKFLRKIHKRLQNKLREAFFASSEGSNQAEFPATVKLRYKELRERIHNASHSLKLQFSLALQRHKVERDQWEGLQKHLENIYIGDQQLVDKVKSDEKDAILSVVGIFYRQGGQPIQIAGSVAEDLVQAYKRGWWKASTKDTKDARDLVSVKVGAKRKPAPTVEPSSLSQKEENHRAKARKRPAADLDPPASPSRDRKNPRKYLKGDDYDGHSFLKRDSSVIPKSKQSRKKNNKSKRKRTPPKRFDPLKDGVSDVVRRQESGILPKRKLPAKNNLPINDRMDSSPSSSNEGESEQWVHCEQCCQWRKLPPNRSTSSLPEGTWVCSMNDWDPSLTCCNVSRDSVPASSPAGDNKAKADNKLQDAACHERTSAMDPKELPIAGVIRQSNSKNAIPAGSKPMIQVEAQGRKTGDSLVETRVAIPLATEQEGPPDDLARSTCPTAISPTPTDSPPHEQKEDTLSIQQTRVIPPATLAKRGNDGRSSVSIDSENVFKESTSTTSCKDVAENQQEDRCSTEANAAKANLLLCNATAENSCDPAKVMDGDEVLDTANAEKKNASKDVPQRGVSLSISEHDPQEKAKESIDRISAKESKTKGGQKYTEAPPKENRKVVHKKIPSMSRGELAGQDLPVNADTHLNKQNQIGHEQDQLSKTSVQRESSSSTITGISSASRTTSTTDLHRGREPVPLQDPTATAFSLSPMAAAQGRAPHGTLTPHNVNRFEALPMPPSVPSMYTPHPANHHPPHGSSFELLALIASRQYGIIFLPEFWHSLTHAFPNENHFLDTIRRNPPLFQAILQRLLYQAGVRSDETLPLVHSFLHALNNNEYDGLSL